MEPIYLRSRPTQPLHIPYFFHGTGATVHLPDRVVTWDFGYGGRVDGFNAARLATFAQSQGERFAEFADAGRVQALLDEAKARGEVVQPYLDQHDDLYYLP